MHSQKLLYSSKWCIVYHIHWMLLTSTSTNKTLSFLLHNWVTLNTELELAVGNLISYLFFASRVISIGTKCGTAQLRCSQKILTIEIWQEVFWTDTVVINHWLMVIFSCDQAAQSVTMSLCPLICSSINPLCWNMPIFAVTSYLLVILLFDTWTQTYEALNNITLKI